MTSEITHEAALIQLKFAEENGESEALMQQVDVLVKLTFEHDAAADTQETVDYFSDYVRGGCQVFADKLTAPVEIVDVQEEATIYGNDSLSATVQFALEMAECMDDRASAYYSHDYCDMELEIALREIHEKVLTHGALLSKGDVWLTSEGKKHVCSEIHSGIRAFEELAREHGLDTEESEVCDD